MAVGVSDGGAAVIAVMDEGACYRLFNEPDRSTAMTWIPVPSLPTGA